MKIKLSKSQWEMIGKKAGWKTAQLFQKGATYKYYINLDERGCFYADVRNQNEKTIFEIKAGDELPEGETSIFEDGFMKNKNDLNGLKSYLVSLGIINKDATIVKGN